MEDKNKGLLNLPEESAIEVILSICFIAGILLCISIITFSELSSRESGILSLLLTILSVIASWLLAKLYGESQHRQAIEEVKEMHNDKIRTFALKAAEKVNNLSEQINRLSIFLEEELSSDAHECDRDSLRAKEERIESAIHILSMLKSVNDTSLSDWHGVIDEEIVGQREAREEREEELREMIHRLEALIAKSNNSDSSTPESGSTIAKQIDLIKKDVRLLMAGVSGTHVPPPKVKKKRTRIDLNEDCPCCSSKLQYTQRALKHSVKTIYCPSCSSTVISRYIPERDTFQLTANETKQETLACPTCSSALNFTLELEPSSNKKVKCGICHSVSSVGRTNDERVSIRCISNANAPRILTEEEIEKVRVALPAQPWPTGTHKVVAEKTGLTNTLAMKAIRELIHRGAFKEQIDGILYDLVPSNSADRK